MKNVSLEGKFEYLDLDAFTQEEAVAFLFNITKRSIIHEDDAKTLANLLERVPRALQMHATLMSRSNTIDFKTLIKYHGTAKGLDRLTGAIQRIQHLDPSRTPLEVQPQTRIGWKAAITNIPEEYGSSPKDILEILSLLHGLEVSMEIVRECISEEEKDCFEWIIDELEKSHLLKVKTRESLLVIPNDCKIITRDQIEPEKFCHLIDRIIKGLHTCFQDSTLTQKRDSLAHMISHVQSVVKAVADGDVSNFNNVHLIHEMLNKCFDYCYDEEDYEQAEGFARLNLSICQRREMQESYLISCRDQLEKLQLTKD